MKDVIAKPSASLLEFREILPKSGVEVRQIDPSCALKLIEQAWCYGIGLGFKPKASTAFSGALNIFGNTDPKLCSQQFDFGWRGKPVYVPGEDTDPEIVVAHLVAALGADGFVVANSEELPPKLHRMR